MVVKVFFDCTWTGPQVDVDANGRETNKTSSENKEIKGMFLSDPSLGPTYQIHAVTNQHIECRALRPHQLRALR